MVATQIFVICAPLAGERIQFDEHIFQMGWNHQLVMVNKIFQKHPHIPGSLQMNKKNASEKWCLENDFSLGPDLFCKDELLNFGIVPSFTKHMTHFWGPIQTWKNTVPFDLMVFERCEASNSKFVLCYFQISNGKLSMFVNIRLLRGRVFWQIFLRVDTNL